MRAGGNVIVYLALCLLHIVSAYENGPPLTSCLNMQPYHKVRDGKGFYPPTLNNAMYRINVAAQNWTNGGTVDVVLTTGTESKFEGFVLTAVRATDFYTDTSIGPLLGSFECNNSQGVAMRYYSAYSPSNASNCVTHARESDYKNVTCVWTAPATNEGPVKFVATAVEDFDKYAKVESQALPNVAGNPSSSSGVGNLTSVPSVSGCGVTKSCALYPTLCDKRGGCTHAVMMTRQADSSLRFEMFGTTVQWIGLGIAGNTGMEETELYTCAYESVSGKTVMKMAYSEDESVTSVFRPEVTRVRTLSKLNSASGLTLPAQPNVIACEFTRPQVSNFTYYKFTKSSYTNQPVRVVNDLANGQYVVLAQGALIGAGSSSMTQHAHSPLKSPNKFFANSITTMYFRGMSPKVQTHATLMTIMWLFLSGVAMVMARHSRPVLTQKPILDKALWFLVHVGCVIGGSILAIAGVIYILVAEGGWESDSQTHGSFGIVCLILMVLNVVAGIFRPEPDAKYRRFFNRLHRWNGLLALLFATITMWLGATFDSLRPEFRVFGIILLSIWTGLQVAFMCGFEFARKSKVREIYQRRAIDKQFRMAGDPKEQTDEEDKPVKGKWVVHVTGAWLLLYTGLFAGILTAFLAGLWLH